MISVVIPARGESKRIPGKNLQRIIHKDLLFIAVEQARAFSDSVYVSTEDERIKTHAKLYGAKVINRPAELARDESLGIDVLQHAAKYISAEWIIFLQPTNPARDVAALVHALPVFFESGADCGAAFWSWNGFIFKGERLETVNRVPGLPRERTQNVEEHLIESGNFYIVRRAALVGRQDYWWQDAKNPFVFRESLPDINDENDIQAFRRLMISEF